MKIDKIIQLGVITSLPIIVLESLRYIFRQYWLESIWMSVLVMLLCVGIYLVYVYSNGVVLDSFKIRFFSSWAAFAITLILIVVFRIFIHNMLDTNYRSQIADRLMERVESKIRKIENEQGIEIERSDTQKERIKLQNSFSVSSLLEGIPAQFLFLGVLALLTAALAKHYH